MKHVGRIAAVSVLSVGLVGGVATGCVFDSELCEAYGQACGGGGGGTGGGTPAGCVPSEDADPVADTCGIFVSSTLGDDANDGSKATPLKTLQAAITKAEATNKPVYACGESFAETITLSAGIDLYGALDCSKGWMYDATSKTQLSANADEVPLRFASSASGASVSDVAVSAADATLAGGSSIAVIVDKADASLVRCELSAGNGAAGEAGMPYASPGQAGVDGNVGGDACTMSQVLGGESVFSMCGMPDSISGAGGIGGLVSGGAGSPGLPDGSMNGGAGEGAMACTSGIKGDDGAVGEGGVGATGIGKVDASGYAGTVGGEGKVGAPGQGGGGGGGAKGGAGMGLCSDPMMAGGAAGGSGGSGGCGGLGGKGGLAGGASIGVVNAGGTLSLSETTIKTSAGGKGGDGGAGQDGGNGGSPGAGGSVPMGSSLKPGCSGGPGGFGGKGGRGGGGLGGASVGIAQSANATTTLSATTVTLGMPGNGGAGADATHDGAVGAIGECWDFAKNAACGM